MKDRFQRTINYLRISVTDRCNLRCRYCMPQDIPQVPMADILTYEEILEIVKAGAACGITRIKVTGGEPLVRKGCPQLIGRLKEVDGIEQVTLTTNGLLLKECLPALKQAGLDAVNVSLDTLDPEKFRKITGFAGLDKVEEGITASLEAGIKTKINVVPQLGVNEEDLPKLALLAEKLPLDVRFIEMMPIGFGAGQKPLDNELLKAEVRKKFPRAQKDERIHGNGPAEYLHIPGWAGSLGFISAIHGKFCSSCNRLRLTSQGRLKPCLCYGDTVDLRAILRDTEESGREARLEEAFRQAAAIKPEAHCFETKDAVTEEANMIEIGG
jgi:cyclic pyranopterin phosphate synthase